MLNANKVPFRKGRLWNKSYIFQMIRNPVYKGEPIYINRQKNENGKKEPVKVRTFTAPVIVEPAIWEMAQQQRIKNRSFADKRKVIANAILRGILTCGECGRAYIITSASQLKYETYRCGDKRAPTNVKTGCKNGGINAFYLDYVVWEAIKNIYAYKSFKEKFNEEREKNIRLLEENQKQIENYLKEKSNYDSKMNKLVGLYLDERITKAIFDDRESEINSTISKIEQQILELEASNKLLERKINQKEGKYNFKDEQLTCKEKAVIAKDLIESAKIYTVSFYRKIVTVKLYMGMQFNLLIDTTCNIRKYAILDDSTVTFNDHFNNNKFLKEHNVDVEIPDFEVTSNNNELFNEEIFGGYSFDEIWKVLDKYGYLKDLPEKDTSYCRKPELLK